MFYPKKLKLVELRPIKSVKFYIISPWWELCLQQHEPFIWQLGLVLSWCCFSCICCTSLYNLVPIPNKEWFNKCPRCSHVITFCFVSSPVVALPRLVLQYCLFICGIILRRSCVCSLLPPSSILRVLLGQRDRLSTAKCMHIVIYSGLQLSTTPEEQLLSTQIDKSKCLCGLLK